jgi:sugar phosphate isomerase/epimerase
VVGLVPKRQFGISTRLYHDERLSREHLLAVAAAGFEAVTLFATRTHFDYHNPAAVADLQQWLTEAGLDLHGIHAPVVESCVGGRWGSPLSLASVDDEAREHAVSEGIRAIQIARRLPAAVLVVHLGLPRSQDASPAWNSRDAARRSLDALRAEASPLGVRLAIEVIPNELSRAGSVVHMVEEELEGSNIGVCLDLGHAHMDGDVLDAIETVSGHLIDAEVHDNRRRVDDHLVPFEGTIGWAAALTAIQKIGYDGRVTFEVVSRGTTKETLVRAGKARLRMERLLAR